MSKLITIPIRKHTKVRRLSRWTLYLDPLLDTGKFITRPITDISKGLENPLDLSGEDLKFVDDWEYKIERRFISLQEVEVENIAGFSDSKGMLPDGTMVEPVKQQKGDWNEWHKDMEEQVVLREIVPTKKHIEDGEKFVGSTPIMSQLGSPKKNKKPNWLTRIKRIGRKK